MQSVETYYQIIEMTTLTSVDRGIINNNKILLGLRNNEPAKGYLFTPGCRTFKYEKLDDAIKRVAKTELNLDIEPSRAKHIGVYDHIYSNNFKDNEFGTHYVNVAYRVDLLDSELDLIKPDEQHEVFQWYKLENALEDEKVHPYVKIFIRNLLG